MAGGKKMRMDKHPKDNHPRAITAKPPPTKAVDKLNSERQVGEVLNNVWSNDMLRDKILEYVIYPTPSTTTTPTSSSNDPQINYRDIPNLRLVQKNWLLSTSRILRQNRHPLYHLHNQNSLRHFVANSEEHKRLINRFISTMARPRRLEPWLPTFRLSLICAFFTPENHKILSDLLEKCGSGLVSLQITIPKSCSMPFLFPPLSLEVLQQLTIELASHSHNDPGSPINPSFLENSGVTYFTQQLINSTTELKTLEVRSISSTDPSLIPLGFQYLSLPPTLSTLLLRGPFSPNHLEITVPRNQTPHLKALQIRIAQASPVLDETTILKALERHGTTLQVLKLSGGKHFLHPRNDQQGRPPSLFKIPPMKNLREITLSSPNWMSAHNFYMTSINFPNLKKFKMKGISLALFESITTVARRLRLQSVQSLEIWLINQLLGTTLTLDQERMEMAHRTFRCVTILEITICGVETSGVKYIFREMANLTSLGITVRKNDAGDDMTCAGFDSLLIGEPEWIAKGLRETPDYWEYFKGRTGYHNNPSIMKLTKLSTLTLATDKGLGVHVLGGGDGADMRGRRLLSEVAFHFALLKMPALETLELFGRFQPNERMINLWKRAKESSGLGGTLVYGLNSKDPIG